MGKQSGLHKWGMCTHLDTHLQMVALFMELFVFLRQIITSSDFSAMLINQYSTAKNMTPALSIYHTHLSWHTLISVWRLFSLHLSGFFSSITIPLPSFSCSLFLQSWADLTPHITLLTISSLALRLFFFPQLSPSLSCPLSICVSASYGVHLSVSVSAPLWSVSISSALGWLAGPRALGHPSSNHRSLMFLLHLLEKFART